MTPKTKARLRELNAEEHQAEGAIARAKDDICRAEAWLERIDAEREELMQEDEEE